MERDILNVVQHDGRAQVGRGDGEADIMQRQPLHSAGVQAVGRRTDGLLTPYTEVLPADLGNIALCGELRGTAARVDHLHVVKRDVLDPDPIESIERDTGVLLAGKWMDGYDHVLVAHGGRGDDPRTDVTE